MKKGAAPIILFLLIAILIIGIVIFSPKLRSSGMSLSEIIGGTRANVSYPQEKYIPDEILVSFNPGVSKADRDNLLQRYSLNETGEIPEIGVKVLKVNPKALDAVIEALSHNPNVEFAEKNTIGQVAAIPTDPYYSSQWGLKTIKAPDAWSITQGSSNVKIAILDTGIQMNHPDLVGKIAKAVDCTGTSCIIVSTSSDNDASGHGTHVAGIAAAATNNGIGVAGMGFKSSLYNVKVCQNDVTCTALSIANGTVWATNNGAKVISMSLVNPSNPAIEKAINYAWDKGAVLVCAAGNTGNTNPVYPAYYSNCIAVASTNSLDQIFGLSTYGSWVDVAAPGISIYSTTKGSGYGYKSGTSMAAPYVSGLAALLFNTVTDTNTNGKKNDEVRSKIESNCDKVDTSPGPYVAYGRINAFKAASPSPPSLLSPYNGATGVSKTPALDWSDTIVTGGWYYVYYKKSTGTSWTYVPGLLKSSNYTFTSTLSSYTKYNWGVWACNIGSSCTSSAIYSFTTRT